ncbi:MAG: hypothetical protein C0625_04180 [Arcobacter sp.]|nr:MAG: hypothetical protein C0625_04180 [Arcobacter sp.]
MNGYVRISNELYHEFEMAAKRKQECELTFVDNKDEINIKTKIKKFDNIDGTEYMDTEDGNRIRLDRIVLFNGEETKEMNHY